MRDDSVSTRRSAVASMIGPQKSAGLPGLNNVSRITFPSRISPDSYTLDQLFLDRPGNDAIQLNLLHNYQSNLALYDGWHEFFRNKQPKTLIVWGKNDPFFTVEGAQAYLRDIPNARLHLLDTGHFALEDSCDFIAQQIVKFFA